MQTLKINRLTALWIGLAYAASLFSSYPAVAASLSLATSPLVTSTTTAVKPNLMYVLDDSGSMAWDHMPDASGDGGSSVTFSYGFYGTRSSQCNQVYYDPSTTYVAPVKADGTSFANASFTGAWDNGFAAGAGVGGSGTPTTVNLNTSFKAGTASSSSVITPDSTGQSAYYYAYSGTQTTLLQKNYHSTTNTFYLECSSAQGASPGSAVFSKRRLATTITTTITVSGSSSTSVSSITVGATSLLANAISATSSSSTMASNIATQINNKTSTTGYTASVSGTGSVVTITGPASAINQAPVVTSSPASGGLTFVTDVFPDNDAAKLQNFANWYSYYRTRILMMKTAAGRAFSSLDNRYRVGLMKISNSSTPVAEVATFESTARQNWYDKFYAISPSGSTPLRQALSNAGRYFAHKLSTTDPVQYSCQQNFSILSTDGYWNTGSGFQLDGSTAVGNQDGTAARPMYDGSTLTTIYTQNSYSTSTIGCSSGKKKLVTQLQKNTCNVPAATVPSTSPEPTSCSGWINSGSATSGSCLTTVVVPSPNPSAAVVLSSNVLTSASSDSLSDVAMYYYKTDLRDSSLNNCTGAVSGENVCNNNVFFSSSDNNRQQHMTTFTLGLGASGLMNYSSSYLHESTNSTGDFTAVATPLVADSTASPPVCSWLSDGTRCNWPVPGMSGSNGLITNIDDLWHAAVDGHGAYFSATNPTTLSAGLSNALGSISSSKGSAAAAATSTLNPVAGDNSAYVASYTTVLWKGNLEARGINTITGAVNENADWCVEDVLPGTCITPPSAVNPSTIISETVGSTTTYYCKIPDSVTCTNGIADGTNCKVPIATSCTGSLKSRVTATTDTRVIKTANSTGTNFTNFDTTYASNNPSYFNAAHIGTLSQWTSLSSTQQTLAQGSNLLNYLRGQYAYDGRSTNVNQLFRYREAVLGDALESQPAFLSKPVFNYPYPGYSCPASPGTCFKEVNANRAGTVYMGVNDGMMHAFDSSSGAERWAYVPSMVIPNMWKLADLNYGALHVNLVNGSPVTSDICTSNCTDPAKAVWKTILVAGLNGGGRGYYALDITDPAAPQFMWEFTTTAGIGKIQDDDLGYSFGQPIVTRRATDGKWVILVTSGYNNAGGPGHGKGFLYVLDAAAGTILSKISTGVGDDTTPSGLAKIAAWNDDPGGGNKAGYIYGGDLLGNVWRFDINSSTAATIGTGSVFNMAQLYSDTAGTSPQPVTTTPVLAKFGEKRLIIVTTGKYLETGDLTTTQTQSVYAIKDDSTATLVNPRTSTTMKSRTLVNNPDGTATRQISGSAVDLYVDRGWFVDLPDSGERVNIDGKLVQGTLLVASLVPSSTACEPGGTGWINFFNYRTGLSIDSTNIVSNKTDAPVVGMNVMYIGGVPKVAIVTAHNPTPELDPNVLFKSSATGFTGKRVIWRELLP